MGRFSQKQSKILSLQEVPCESAVLKFGWEVVYSPSSLISKSAAVQAPGMNHLHILVFQSGLLLTKSLMCLPKSCLMSRIPWHTGRTTRRWKRCRGSMGCPFLMSSGWLPGRSSRRKPGPGTTGRSGRCACQALLRCSVTKARNLAVLMLTFLLPSLSSVSLTLVVCC